MRNFKKSIALSLTSALMILALLVSPLAQAQIIIPVLPRPIHQLTLEPLLIKTYIVKIEINNQLANVKVEQVFYNPNDRALEGSYLFPIPKGAVISNLTLCTSGKECVEGELLDADKARRLYHDIVRKTLDPALLEYVGDKAFQVRIFPIPAKGEQRIVLNYQQLLEREGDLVELVYPLTAEKNVQQFAINVTIREDEPIGSVYSPSHKIVEQRISDREVQVSFESTGLESGQDFVLYYALSKKDLSLQLLPYREKGEDGYFILLLSPGRMASLQQALPKDIVFVFDISGSMSGEKLEQAKQSLKYAIGQLAEQDRFGLIVFSDLIREFKSGSAAASKLVPTQGLNKDEVYAFIDGLEAGGSTDIDAALLRGLDYFEANERLKILVFLTDGLPTFGEQDPAKIIKNVSDKNILGSRIFVFGVGYDVNTKLLDRISQENGGFSTYVEPGESIEREVTNFYNKVGSPLLTDLKLIFEGIETYDLYPRELPDLFKGSELQVLGRYRGTGTAKAILKAYKGQEAMSFTFEVHFPEENRAYSFLPRIWASRKIGYLLEQIRLYGENEELVKTIKDLATKFGIATPYTSYLATPEDEEADLTQARSLRLNVYSGAQAVKSSEALRALKEQARAIELKNVRQASGKTFIFQNESWRPTDYSDQPTIKVKFGSEAYFWLADNFPVRDYLALGRGVIFLLQGSFMEISDEGATDPGELEQIQIAQPPSTEATISESRFSLGVTIAIVVAAFLVLSAAGFLFARR